MTGKTAEAEKAARAARGNLSVEASATRRTWSCGTGKGQKSQGQITTCRPERQITTCRPEMIMTNGGVVQAQGVTGPRFYNEAAPGVTRPTGISGNLHESYSSLCSALPGGKHRGREIREAKDPAKAKALGEIGKTLPKTRWASPATSTFAPPVLGVEPPLPKTTSLKIIEKESKRSSNEGKGEDDEDDEVRCPEGQG